MFKIDTLHITFKAIDKDVNGLPRDLHELTSCIPFKEPRKLGGGLFDVEMWVEPVKALHGYTYGYAIIAKEWLGDTQTFKNHRAGSIFYGGNAGRPFLQLNGYGCTHVDMLKLHEVVKTMNKVKITRCDVAYDDVYGIYGTMATCVEAYKNDMFTKTRTPVVSQVGDWISEDDQKGRTLYIGSRKGSKMLRIYEKGKEQHIKDSPWIRYEIEFKNIDYIIPVDILLNPESYFTGAYPFTSQFISDKKSMLFVLKPKLVDELEGQALWDHRVKYAKMQAGTVLFEHLVKNDGDLGSLCSFAKSSKINVKRLDKITKTC